MDRFSALVIYLSLAALRHDARLWLKLDASEDRCMLLQSEDYLDPLSSARISELKSVARADQSVALALTELLGALDERRAPEPLARVLNPLVAIRGSRRPRVMAAPSQPTATAPLTPKPAGPPTPDALPAEVVGSAASRRTRTPVHVDLNPLEGHATLYGAAAAGGATAGLMVGAAWHDMGFALLATALGAVVGALSERFVHRKVHVVRV